jgi:hypothetical protein
VIARWVLALLLFAMAAGQMNDLGGFIDIVATYKVGGGTSVAATLAVVLIAGELVAAAGLVTGDTNKRRPASTIALGVALAWTVLATQAFVRGLGVDNCGCFGVHAGQQLRWWVLIEDLEFVTLAWWVRARSSTGSSTSVREDLVASRVT